MITTQRPVNDARQQLYKFNSATSLLRTWLTHAIAVSSTDRETAFNNSKEGYKPILNVQARCQSFAAE